MVTYFVYFLKYFDGSYVTGITNDLTQALQKRYDQSTYDMIAVETYATISEALERKHLFDKFQCQRSGRGAGLSVHNLLGRKKVF